MTSHSEHGGYIRGLAELVANKGPVDTAAARDALVNNTNHLLDECTQVRGSVTLKAGQYFGDEDNIGGIDAFAPPFRFYAVRMPLQIRRDGRSVAIVPHLRASVSAGTLTIRVFLSLNPGSRRATVNVPPVGDDCAEVTTTSTTAVDLVPSPIWLPSSAYDVFRDARPPRPVGVSYPSLDAAGRPSSFVAPVAWLHVRWKISTAAGPKLYGISWREFIE